MKPTIDSADYYERVQEIPEIMMRAQILSERLHHQGITQESRILEVGVGSGDITIMLARMFGNICFIEPDKDICNLVLRRLKDQSIHNTQSICSFFEDAVFPIAVYDHIIMLGVLEHMEDPVIALKKAASLLKATGKIHITVNLAGSLHRWFGVALGMIHSPEELTEADILHGHHRVYTPALLKEQLQRAGLSITFSLPYYLKPLTTGQLKHLSAEHHQALFRLGQQFPDLSAYLYAEAQLP